VRLTTDNTWSKIQPRRRNESIISCIERKTTCNTEQSSVNLPNEVLEILVDILELSGHSSWWRSSAQMNSAVDLSQHVPQNPSVSKKMFWMPPPFFWWLREASRRIRKPPQSHYRVHTFPPHISTNTVYRDLCTGRIFVRSVTQRPDWRSFLYVERNRHVEYFFPNDIF